MSSLAPNLHDFIIAANDEPKTTSLKVAEAFGKRHTHVLDKIKNLGCSPEFTSANFSAHVEMIKAGAVSRESTYYEMTKDGFMFLVMGFTGKEAARIKEAYIHAFNWMAEQLAVASDQNPLTNIPRYAQSLTLPEISRLTAQPVPTITSYLAHYYQIHPEHTQQPLAADIQHTLQHFWLGVGILMGAVDINHATDPQILAINLRHLYREAATHQTTLPALQRVRRMLRLSRNPLYIRYSTVRSRIFKRPTKAWQFQHAIHRDITPNRLVISHGSVQ